MDLPRILPIDNEERIRTLMCDGLKTLGITDQCPGLATRQRRHTQVGAKIAGSSTFSTAAAYSEHIIINRTVRVYINSDRAAYFFNG